MTFNNVAKTEKIEEVLMKNMNDVFKAFSNIDHNLKIVKLKSEESKDKVLDETTKIIEIEQQNVKNLVTSSFQQMKEYLHAIKACQKQILKDSQVDLSNSPEHISDRNVQDDERNSFGIRPKNSDQIDQVKNDAN